MTETEDRESTFHAALFSGGMDLDGMEALLSLYRELYPLRQAGPEIDPKFPPDDEISMRLGEGFTLLETGGLLPPGMDFSAHTRTVAKVLAGHSENPVSVDTVLESVEDPARFSGLVDSYMVDGEGGLREGSQSLDDANTEIVSFIVFNVLKPLFLSAGRQFAKVRTDQWNRGRCPVCGGEPAVSYMAGEGGKRFLICHRCETNWRFRRLICPLCDHESPGESSFLYIEEPRYRNMTGYVCNKCSCYIKTWRIEDEALGAFHPEVEDLKTPGFDAAMESEGYRRGVPNIFGVLVSELASGGKNRPND